MNTAAAYIRVSTADQALHGVSLEAQLERIKGYCTMQGLQLVAIIREEGVSASKPLAVRPGGQELLALLAAGEVQHIVALKLDRLFRDAADCLNQTKAWDKANVALHLVDMGGTAINSASPMGRMFLTMTAAFAELERNLISERTKDALRFKQQQGVRLGAPPIGGTPEEIQVLRYIVSLRTEGLSLQAIADRLNQESVRAKRGSTWYGKTVSNCLHRAEVA